MSESSRSTPRCTRLARRESCDLNSADPGNQTPVCSTPPLPSSSQPHAVVATPLSPHAHPPLSSALQHRTPVGTDWTPPPHPDSAHSHNVSRVKQSEDQPTLPLLVTPLAKCDSPPDQGWDSFHLPAPSHPWAPPPSPNSPTKSYHSLPSSPTGSNRFRFSQEIPEDHVLTDFQSFLEPPTDDELPCASNSLGIKRRPSPWWHTANDPFELPEGSLTAFPSHTKAGSTCKRDSLCSNLEIHFPLEGPSLTRSRSHSNPAHAVRKQSATHALTLCRTSSNSPPSSLAASSSYKCYRIRLKRDYRLSSSMPNLSLRSTASCIS